MIMQEEYDLTQLKVKRRGLLVDLPTLAQNSPDMLDNYDFSNGVRGKYAARFKQKFKPNNEF